MGGANDEVCRHNCRNRQITGTAGETALDNIEQLNEFLAGVERRALRMAEFAVGSREDALDLVQDAMIKLAEKYGRRPPDEWGPLFHRILQSRIRDWYRRERVRGKRFAWRWRDAGSDEDDPVQTLADPSADPLRQLLSERATPALIDAIRRLPFRQQQVFLLRAWEGLDVGQTAAAMRCGAGSVKTHYHRAVQALRSSLRDYQGDEEHAG